MSKLIGKCLQILACDQITSVFMYLWEINKIQILVLIKLFVAWLCQFKSYRRGQDSSVRIMDLSDPRLTPFIDWQKSAFKYCLTSLAWLCQFKSLSCVQAHFGQGNSVRIMDLSGPGWLLIIDDKNLPLTDLSVFCYGCYYKNFGNKIYHFHQHTASG